MSGVHTLKYVCIWENLFPSHSGAWYIVSYSYNNPFSNSLSSLGPIMDIWLENRKWKDHISNWRPHTGILRLESTMLLKIIPRSHGTESWLPAKTSYWHDRRSGTLLLLPCYLWSFLAVHGFCIGAIEDWPLGGGFVPASWKRPPLFSLLQRARSPVTEVHNKYPLQYRLYKIKQGI